MPTELLPFLSAREKVAERLLRRTNYRIPVQLPDKSILYVSVHIQAQHHEVIASLLNFSSVGGKHGKHCAALWDLWLSEPDRPALLIPDDAVMLDVLLSCARWRDGGDGLLFLLRKRALFPDAAHATTAGLPAASVTAVLPVR